MTDSTDDVDWYYESIDKPTPVKKRSKTKDFIAIIVCGPRKYTKRSRVFRVLNKLHKEREIAIVVQGGASGADAFAGEWADANEVWNWKCNARWKKWGKRAGSVRNKAMACIKPVTICVAFGANQGTPGTKNMIETAKAAGIKVLKYK